MSDPIDMLSFTRMKWNFKWWRCWPQDSYDLVWVQFLHQFFWLRKKTGHGDFVQIIMLSTRWQLKIISPFLQLMTCWTDFIVQPTLPSLIYKRGTIKFGSILMTYIRRLFALIVAITSILWCHLGFVMLLQLFKLQWILSFSPIYGNFYLVFFNDILIHSKVWD